MPRTRDEVLTPEELARELKLSEASVYREQREGKLPGVLVRGKLRFKWGEVFDSLQRAPVAPSHQPRLAGFPADDIALWKQRAKACRM